MRRIGPFTLLVAILVFLGVEVHGQEGLYAPLRPENTAFVRVATLGRPDSGASPPLMIGSVRFAALTDVNVTPYRLVPVDGYVLGGRGGTFFTPEAGSFYTIVRDNDPAFTIVEDEAHNDRARAQVNLYNFANRPLSLRALRPAGTILEVVAPGERTARSLNAITAEFQVFSDGTPYGSSHTVQMVRGGSYSLFAFELSNGEEVTVAVEASVATE